MKVAIIAHGALKSDAIFDLSAARDNALERFFLLRKALHDEGAECRTADRFSPGEMDVLVFQDLHRDLGEVLRTLKKNPCVRLVYLAIEPRIILPLHDDSIVPFLPVEVVLTWNDAITGSGRVVKANIGQPEILCRDIPRLGFAEKKFISCICANKSSKDPAALYGERMKAIEFFSSQPEGIDLFGVGWESSVNAAVVGSFRGRCRRKKDVQREYRFSLAYENATGFPGLITEKIFDCFAAGTVPVYYGAPNVTDYIPPGCFVDLREFPGYPELHRFLVRMTENEYNGYLYAAVDFLRSAQYREFTAASFAEILVREIKRVYWMRPSPRSPLSFKAEIIRLVLQNPRALRNPGPFKRLLLDLATSW